MKEPLLDKIKKELPMYKTGGVRNMLIIVLAILQTETCCLYRLQGAVGRVSGRPGATRAARYQRVLRFFRQYSAGDMWVAVLGLCWKLLRLKVDHLVLDGTSWQYGNRHIHLLMLCVVYKGVAIPIYWHDLGKKGTSNSGERKELFLRAMQRPDLSGKLLLADREYVGREWFRFLLDHGIPFIIRLKKGHYRQQVDLAGGMRYSALEKKLLRSKKHGKAVSGAFMLDGMALRLVMTRNGSPGEGDRILYLLTGQGWPAKKIAGTYSLRWRIENCFKHMKTNGFNLERINLRDAGKARLMIALLVLAYTLSVLEGLKDYERAPVKRYANGKVYKAVSAFRKGLDTIAAKYDYFENLALYLIRLLGHGRKAWKSPKAIFV